MTKDRQLEAEGPSFTCTIGEVKFWLGTSYSEFWYRDAVREAQGSDEHAIRREIIFSVCFLESYIFEWTRDLLTSHNYKPDKVNDYFPPESRCKNDPRYRRGLKEKWKCVPAELFDDEVIPTKPDLVSSEQWNEFCTLMKYRNGFIHALASRSSTDSLNSKAKPVPAVGTLRDRPHGWAISVAEKLVKKLHQDIGTPCPIYIR